MTPQFTTEQLQGIVSEDKERLIYEIQAETEYANGDRMSFWPKYSMQLDIWWTDAQYYNSNGKHIATFRRKK